MLDPQDYKAKLDYIKSLDPDNAFISKLEQGPTLTNSVLIENILKKLPIPNRAVTSDYEPVAKDPMITRFNVQLRNQITQKSKLSNALHLCQSDYDRAKIVKAIQEIDDKIEQIMIARDAYEDKQELPVYNNEKYPIPDDPISLISKRNSLRSSITRYKNDIMKLHKLGAEKSKIVEKEQKLQESKIYLTYVDQAISAKAVHRSGV